MSDTAIVKAGSNIATVLKHAPLTPLENRILLMHVLQLTKAELITAQENIIDAQRAHQLSMLFQRRLKGEPIAYLIGYREFYSLQLEVTPAVLIPRPETELLVELAIQYAAPQTHLLELGTGSGAIAIAIAHHRPDLYITATDISTAALAVAKRNSMRHLESTTQLQFVQSDWYSALLPQQQFDTITANPPYIAAGDPHLGQGDLRFEPVDALTDHADGLTALRHIIQTANLYLKKGGWLLMEHGYNQAPAVRSLLKAERFDAVQSWNDLAGIERISGAKR